MEDRLALRLQLFRDSGQAPPQVTRFVEEELTALAGEGHPVTEDTAGMLTSHLVMALTRLLNGEPIEQFLTDEDVAAELADQPRAVERARAISLRAEKELGAALPDSEINFLAMHLAVLRKNGLRRDVS
ncbi:PRD domain-containing protein [Streptomyces sp. NPDC000151]|uniref:PRD domain-containing protein n=1 Tax=Streptomyces sp. NPDC000151 TaxID=3154244 RepID=UPI00332C6B14